MFTLHYMLKYIYTHNAVIFTHMCILHIQLAAFKSMYLVYTNDIKKAIMIL